MLNEAVNPSLPARLREWLLPSATMQRHALAPLLGLGYVLLIGVLGGLRMDHVLIGSLGLLDLYNEKTRLFLRRFFPFIATGAIYDSMRYFYWPGVANRVHVEEPYALERSWFGIGGLTPNEWLLAHQRPALDLACGFAYLVFVGEYLATAFLLFFRQRLDVHSEAAAASRFDLLLGTHFFDGIYGRGIDVYGAYPSLHVAYPLLVIWATFRARELRWARAPAIAFFLLMCFSAVYLQHHYVIDVLLGVAYAIVTLALLGILPALAHRSAARASSAQPAASGSPRAPASMASRSACE